MCDDNELTLQHPFAAHALMLIEARVIAIIGKYQQDAHYKPESGGILLGYRRDRHLHIVDATVPQTADRRTLFQFWRRDRRHQEAATKLWGETNETGDYLGEWHTHPEIQPMPSGLDLAEWRKICKNRVFLIAGTRGAMWTGVGQGDAIRPCPSDAQS
ncbi:Mov34/MPN/PAD-1 family protein [Cupriavidus taiwanensis]|uniref:JAB domain-containing protein n=1 Tax=Cupriavidus taiwanensis TaxID=164546 RepID=A0A375JGC7_9BURK|nr:Mov34/MPN/PAD-1 family protein [Cupriavidus taiwanensis]SPS03063.1 conserved hypothetical protein [Cupriavidus taiwanensis]